MPCPHCQSTATTEGPDRTALGYRRLRCRTCTRGVNERTGTPCHHLHYPTEVGSRVVLGRFRYKLSLRDLAEMVLQRGIVLPHEAVRNGERKLAPRRSDTLRNHRYSTVGDSWDVDETDVRVDGRWQYLARAIDRDGNLGAVRRSDTRALVAAEACFRSAWPVTGMLPARITTDGHDAYRRALRNVLGDQVAHRTNRDLNNPVEQDHRGLQPRDRSLCGGKHGIPAARFCRVSDEGRSFRRPQKRHHQLLALTQRRGIQPERGAQWLGLMAAAYARSASPLLDAAL